jgi:hypothetical protein
LTNQIICYENNLNLSSEYDEIKDSMNFSLSKILILISVLLCFSFASAQDTIVMKDGSKIASKVMEITPDWVKYKNWSYKDGPTYYLYRLDVVLIKYSNGTKDEFKTSSGEEAKDSLKSTPKSADDKFSGQWFPSNYDGSSVKSILNIRKMGEDYLVEYAVCLQIDSATVKKDGSFKELGKLDGNSIQVNSQVKLSLIDSTYILLNNTDFFKKPGLILGINNEIGKSNELIKNQQVQIQQLKQKITQLTNNLKNVPKEKSAEETTLIRSVSKQIDLEEKKLDELNIELSGKVKKLALVKTDQ